MILATLIFYFNIGDFFVVSKTKDKNKLIKTVRKEIRDLKLDEWRTYKKAFLKLKSHGLLDDLAEMHDKMATYAHNSILFLPWHRALVKHFEDLLKIVNNNSKLSVPYWDWRIDAADPNKSIIFDEEHWGFKDCYEVAYPHKHCLLRNEKPLDPFYNKTQVSRLLKKKMPFGEFSEEFELVPHGIVHFNVGGEKGDMSEMWSVNDPIFWHHHSFCDYLWHQRQLKGFETEKTILKTILKPFEKTVEEIDNLTKLNIHYQEFNYVNIQCKEEKIPARISEEYAKKHGYNFKKVKDVEDFMFTGNQKQSFWRKILGLFFCIDNDDDSDYF